MRLLQQGGKEHVREYKSFYKKVGGNEGDKCHYSTRLDTYGCGCQHDCSYCYAKSLLSFRKLWNPQSPSVADIQKIRRKINRLNSKEVIRLGGMTDCFQPLEKKERVTYETIKALNKKNIPYLIVTKSSMVADDEYIEVMRKELAHIQITVTTLDDDLAKTYEKATPPSERIKAIKKLQSLGFDVQLRLSPYIPEYIDTEKLAGLGIDRICVEFLRVNTWVKRWFDLDYKKYIVKQNGYNHLSLEEKKKLVAKLKGFKELTVCEDETEAYNYWKKNVNYNSEDCCNLKTEKE